MSSVVVIVVFSCALAGLLIGIVCYFFRRQIRNGCHSAFHRKKRVHQITVPVRPTGENEILAVTQRRENVPRGSLNQQRNNNNPAEPISLIHPPYPLTRHQSLLNNQSRRTTQASWSDFPSPSLQSLLMSSQVAVFNSSTERLSLSSERQNQAQLIFQPISMHQQLLQHQLAEGAAGYQIGVGASSPYSVSPALSSSSIHLPQPIYFDETPPSYQESMLIRKLRASNRSAGSQPLASQHHNTHFNAAFPSSRMGMGMLNSRRSCRM